MAELKSTMMGPSAPKVVEPKDASRSAYGKPCASCGADRLDHHFGEGACLLPGNDCKKYVYPGGK